MSLPMPRDPRFHGSTTAAGSPGRSSRYGAAGPGRGARPGTSAGRFASDAQRTLCEPDKRADAAVRPCTDRVFESHNRELGEECGLKVRLNSKTAWAFLVPLVLLLSAGPAVRLSADASVRYIEVTAPRDWLLSGSTLQLEARAQRLWCGGFQRWSAMAIGESVGGGSGLRGACTRFDSGPLRDRSVPLGRLESPIAFLARGWRSSAKSKTAK